MKISIVQLIKAKACPKQVKLFRKLFGKEAGVTLKNCEKAGKAGMSFCWAIANLFPDKQEAFDKEMAPAQETFYKEMAPAQETFDRARAKARETFYKATANSWETLNKARAKAQETYNKEIANARETFNKEIDPAWETLNKARAKEFYKVMK